MAVYNPHLLSHKICRVLDAGHVTVDDLARMSEEPVKLIERLAKGEIPISVDSRMRIGKALSVFFRAHPELYRDQRPAEKRGVIEESSPRADERSFTLRDTVGKWRGTFRFPASEVTPETIKWLWRVLDKMDPRRLEIIS